MKRGIILLAFIIGILLWGYSTAWCSWQYAESETETTSTSTAYMTKVQEVAGSSGYHLILASWELGIDDTAAFALARVMQNSTTLSDLSLQTFGGANRYRTFAFHSILNLTAGDSIKIAYATNDVLRSARIRRARILLVPLSGMEYSTGTGLNVMNLGTSWSNAASGTITPATSGDYLVVASMDIRPNSSVASGEARVELDGSESWDLMTMEGKSVSDRVPYFSARVVHLSAAAHTLRLQARSDEGTATDIYSPRISVIRLTKKFNDYSQGEQLTEDSTTSGADNWVNRLQHVHQPFQAGSYLALGYSLLGSVPDVSVQPEERWTAAGQEENRFLGVMKDSTDFLPFVGFKVFSWDISPETLTVDYGKNSPGSEQTFIKDARLIAVSEQLYTGFPVLDPIGPKGLVEGDTLIFKVHSSDPDADPITLKALNVPANATFIDSGDGSGSFSFTPAFYQAGTYNVTFIATDTTAKADTEVVTIPVSEFGNNDPVLDSIGAQSVSEGETLSVRIHATDLDLDSLILSALNVPTNAVFVDSGNGAGSFVFTPDFTQSGIYDVTFKVADTLGAVDSEVVEITVNNVIRPPVLEGIGPQAVDEGGNLSLRIHATDPDGDSIILNALSVPANAIFVDSGNGSGSFVFDPDYTQAGINSVTFIAADTFLAADTEIVQITVNNVNRDPVLDAIGAQSLVEGETLSIRIHATDADLDSLILSALNLPTNAVFVDSGNGAGSFVFTPDFTQANVYNVTFKVADTLGGVDSEAVQITVTEFGNHAPVLDSIGPRSVVEGDTLSFKIHATDLDLDSIILSAVDVPANAVFVDSGNGAGSFVFTPGFAQAGIYDVIFKSGDPLGGLDSEVVEITVTEFGNHSPELASIGAKSLSEGDTLIFSVHATDLDLDSLILSVLNVPPNAVFVDSGNGAGSFVFTPDFTQSGIYDVTFKVADTLGGVDSEVVQITVNNVIRPPVLEGIGPQAVDEGGNLSLRIHATDPDGDLIILNALDVPTNAVFADSGNGASSLVFNPDYTQSGIYNVTFIAADTFLAADTEIVQITVNNVNRDPVLDAIGPLSLAEGETLSIRIHATDVDLDSLILSAFNVPTNAIFVDSGNGAGSFVFTPDFTQAGIYAVTFKVADTLGAVDSEVVQITVGNTNRPPVLAAIGSQAVNEAQTLQFRISGTDPDGDLVHFSAVGVPTNATFVDSGNGAGSFTFSPNYDQAGPYNVTFIASDGSLADSEIVAITVNNVNRPPDLASIGPRSVIEGGHLGFLITSSDPDGDTIVLSARNLPNHSSLVDSGNGKGSFKFDPDYTQSGIYYVTFKASDYSLADSEVVQITVIDAGNQAPVLDSIGPQNTAEAGTLQFRVHASDPDGNNPALFVRNNPTNSTFVDSGNGAGSFTFNPNYDQAGVYYVSFVATDGIVQDSERVQITVAQTNRPPVLDSIGPKAVTEGDSIMFRVHATDPDGDPLVLSALGLPAHAGFVDSGNGAGTFKFIPAFNQSGIYSLTFKAFDGALVDSEVVTLTVNDAGNHAPVLSSIGAKSVDEGGSLSFRISATDLDSDSLILSAENLPANAAFVDSGNGAGSLVFDPDYTQSGPHDVTFIASDGAAADSEVVPITVNNVDRPPVLVSIGPQTVMESETLAVRIFASDPDGDSVALSAKNVPANATFTDSGNGAGSFVFTPDFTQSGVYYVTFTASSAALTDSEVVQITVTEFGNHAPVLDSIGPKAVVEGDSLEFRIHAADIDLDSIILSALDVPTNAVFVDSGNGAGSLVFHPDFDQSGLYHITFIASDGSLADSEVVDITVSEFGNHAPVLDSIGPKVVVEGDHLEFGIHAVDIDSDAITLTALDVPTNAVFVDSGNGAGSFIFDPDYVQSGLYHVTFIASDGSLSDSEVVDITVSEFGNNAPVLDSIGPKAVVEGSHLEFGIHAVDIDSDAITLTALDVPTNAVFVDSGNGSGSLVFDPDFNQSGIYHVTFIASDGSLSDSEVVDITVSEFGNHAPVLDSIGPKVVVEGSRLEFGIHASDIDLDSIILTALDVPTNAVFVDSGNGAGSFIFDPNYVQSGLYHVTFIASDGSLADSEVVDITVSEFGNNAPVLDSIGPKAVVEGSSLQFRIHAVDADADSLILSALDVPTNAVFVDSGNGAGSFIFDPDYVQSGLYHVTFIASDGSLSDSEVVDITVSEFGNNAPVLDSIGPKAVVEGSHLEFGIHAVDIDSDAITLTALDVPTNAVFVDSGNGSGSFVFDPNYVQAGLYHVTFIASDGSLSDSEVVDITVSEFGNHAPVLDSIGPKAVVEGDHLEFGIRASDIDLDSIILTALDVPTNAIFVDSGNGSGSLVFDPDYVQSGLYHVTFIASDGSLSDSEVVDITVSEFGNNAPVLDSIGPQTVEEGSSLQFRVHAADVDLDPITLQALNVPSNAAFVDSGDGSGLLVFNPDFTQSGVYHVTFIASDGSLSDSEVVDITVNEFGNHAPVLDSIGPKAVVEGDSLEFRIHAIDIDSDPLTLSASDVPLNATFVDSGNGAGSFVFAPSYAQAGTYYVTFRAMDGFGGGDSEVVQIDVGDYGNHPPALDSIGPKSLAEGDTLRIRVHAQDLDLDSLILSAQDVPVNGTFEDSGNGSGSFMFAPNFTQSGIYEVTFIASDGFSADSQKVEITVTETGNHAPVLDSIGPKSVMEGGSLTFRVHAVDVDADPIFLQAYGLPRNAVFVDSGNGSGSFVINPDFAESGTYSVTFVVNDLSGEADSEVVELSVIEAGNHAPVLDPIGPRSISEKTTLTFRIHASDVDLDHIALNAFNLPTHASVIDSGNGAGSFTFSPDSTQSGVYNVTFTASDALLADSEVVQITVTEWANHPPVLDSIGPKTVHEGDSLVFTVSASDSDGTIPVLTVDNLPDSAVFTDNHNGHGLFRFKPTFYQAGIETVTFAAIDISNPPPLSDLEKVVITILDVNQAPTFDSIGPRTIQAGQTLNVRVVGRDPTDPDGGPLHLSAINLPTHAAFHDSGGGVGGFTFTPDYSQVGVDTVTFFCTDEGTPPLSGIKNVEITVTAGANRPPVLDSIGYKMVTEGGTLRFRVHATDPDGTTPVLYTSQPLPQNAVFVDSANGAGSFTFSPSYVQSGLYQITFYASDGQLSDHEQIMIQVVEAGNQAPILDSIGARSLMEGDSLEIRIHAVDPEGNTITLSLRNNPANSSLVDSGNGAGVFRFKPSYVESGIYNMIFKATDSYGAADSEVVQITVIEAGNQPPYVDSIGPKSVTEWQWLTFVVTAHDPDENTPTLRAFGLPPTASFTDNHNGTGSFVYRPNFYEQGVYNTRFEAVDSVDTLLKGWRMVQITVIDSNQFPVITLSPDSIVSAWHMREGQTCQFRVIGTDPDSTVPYPHIRPLPANATFVDSGNGVGLFTFIPGYNQGGAPQPKTYAESSFVVDQIHPKDTTWSATLKIYVYDTPEPPNIVPINDTTIVEGQRLDIHVVTTSTTDIPTLKVVGQPANASFVDSANGRGAFRFTPDYTQASTYLVRFVATSRGLTDTEAVTITVTEWGNHPPVLDSIGPRAVGEGSILSFRVHATDLDMDHITLTARNVPTNATFTDSGNGAGSFVFHPDWQQSGIYYVTFTAADIHAATDSEVVQITVENVNQTPVLDHIGPKTVLEGQTLQFRVHATDVEGDSLILTAAPLPLHASFHDSGNGAGVFTFSPSYYQAGVYSVIFTASDRNTSAMEIVPITVTNVPQPPDLDSIGPRTVNEGDSLKFRIHATDPDGDPITLSLSNNPTNSSLVDSGNGSGVFRFKPSYVQSGVYLVTFRAADNTGKVDSELVQITVNEVGDQRPDLYPLPDSVQQNVGDTLRWHIYATDPDGPSITLSVAGLSRNYTLTDSGNGGGYFKFVPDSTQADSTYHVIFAASDGTLADSEFVVMHVTSFARGDANSDGNVDLGDLVFLLNYLYKAGPPPVPLARGDANCDVDVNLGDLVYLINYLYKAGPAPQCHKE